LLALNYKLKMSTQAGNKRNDLKDVA
jgi:hypothetical protein